MENVLYNDLIRRGYDVDVGVVEYNCREYSGKKIRRQLEIDFVVNKADERCYIQSALSVADPDLPSNDNDNNFNYSCFLAAFLLKNR